MKTEKFLVEGRVQGVGFRYFVQAAAHRIGVSGYVRNLRDGRVECEATGNDEQLERFYQDLLSGPPLAKVSSVDRIQGAKDFSGGFFIR